MVIHSIGEGKDKNGKETVTVYFKPTEPDEVWDDSLNEKLELTFLKEDALEINGLGMLRLLKEKID